MSSGACEECRSPSELLCISCDALFCKSCFDVSHPAKSRVLSKHVTMPSAKLDRSSAKLRESVRLGWENMKTAAAGGKTPSLAVGHGPYSANIPEHDVWRDTVVNLETLKKQLRDNNTVLRAEIKNLQGYVAAQKQEIARWDAEVAQIQSSYASSLGGAGQAVDGLLSEIMTLAQGYRSSELAALCKSKDQARALLQKVKSASRSDNPVVLTAAIAEAQQYLQGSVVNQIDGQVEVADITAQAQKLAGIVADAGKVRVKFIGEDLHDQSKQLFESKNEEGGMQTLFKAAEKGYVPAQVELANRLVDGNGCSKDSKSGFKWASVAATSPSVTPEAMYVLGKFHYYGHGTDADKIKGVEWYSKAAVAGHAGATHELAMVVERDVLPLDKALPWLEKSASNNDLDSIVALGNLYKNGTGVAQDSNKAVEFYRKAAEKNYAAGQHGLATMLQATDFAGSLRLFTAAAQSGHAPSQVTLGFLFENGSGVPKDLGTALKYYVSAANQGDATAQMRAAYLYEQNVDEKVDGQNEARKWYKAAAQKGEMFAVLRYGQLIEPYNAEEAFQCYKNASEKGYEYAMVSYAKCFLEGIGTQVNYEKALEWYNKAAEKNVPEAWFRLGFMHIDAQGVPENVEKAKEYLNKAAAANHPQAIYVLQVSAQRGFMMTGKELAAAVASPKPSANRMTSVSRV
jgi:TPR repeat protein